MYIHVNIQYMSVRKKYFSCLWSDYISTRQAIYCKHLSIQHSSALDITEVLNMKKATVLQCKYMYMYTVHPGICPYQGLIQDFLPGGENLYYVQ